MVFATFPWTIKIQNWFLRRLWFHANVTYCLMGTVSSLFKKYWFIWKSELETARERLYSICFFTLQMATRARIGLSQTRKMELLKSVRMGTRAQTLEASSAVAPRAISRKQCSFARKWHLFRMPVSQAAVPPGIPRCWPLSWSYQTCTQPSHASGQRATSPSQTVWWYTLRKLGGSN